jgi:vacuolar-type H+-ATPase subunit H
MVETDIIGHLIDVEHRASSLVLDAQIEADQRIADARSRSDIRYKELYEELVDSLDKQAGEKIHDVKLSYEKESKDFSLKITKTPKDIPAFEDMLESLLFKAY